MTAPPPTISRLARVAQTSPLGPADEAEREGDRFVWAARQLPTLFRTPMVAHALSPRLPAPATLAHLVVRLRGRLTVVNPIGAARLPAGLAIATRALVRRALDGTPPWTDDRRRATTPFDPRPGPIRAPRSVRRSRADRERRLASMLLATASDAVRARIARGASWASLALYEATTPAVRLDAVRAAAFATGEPAARAAAAIAYRLAIIVGDGPPPNDWHAIDAAVERAPATSWPPSVRRGAAAPSDEVPAADGALWFVGQLLVPDEWLIAHADARTCSRWAWLTGRGGARDGYWFPESWERFLEPGRAAGCVTPADIWRVHRGRLGGAGARDVPRDEDASPAIGSLVAPSSLTPDIERGVGVPPGYALIDIVGTLGVAIVAM